MKNLQQIIDTYNDEAVLLQHEEDETCYIISNFPDKLHQSIKDYVNCHYEVYNQDNYSITFKI